MDETGGGVEAHCFGDASKDGFYYFYDMVKPGDPAPALKGRYTIPRNQGSEICVSHNATVIPIKGRKLMSVSYYQGGVSVVDFTDPSNIREVAFSDIDGRRRRVGRVVLVLVQRPHLLQQRPRQARRRPPTAASTSTALTGALGHADQQAPSAGATPTRRRRRHGRRRKAPVLLVALLAAAALGACGGEDDAAAEPGTPLAVPWLDPDGEFPVVGSLAVNPADGKLWMATNTGLFRVPGEGKRPRRSRAS